MIAGAIGGPTYKHSFNDGKDLSSLELASKTTRNFVVVRLASSLLDVVSNGCFQVLFFQINQLSR